MSNQSQTSDEPSLCASNCGFFGNPATNNLCSKCYKDFLVKQTRQLENSMALMDSKGDEQINKTREKTEGGGFQIQADKAAIENNCSSSSSSSSSGPSRCSFCRKRVGLTGFKCRCGLTFCSLHRYSDKHECVFDYKAAGQDAIARANPVVKADKVDKI